MKEAANLCGFCFVFFVSRMTMAFASAYNENIKRISSLAVCHKGGI